MKEEQHVSSLQTISINELKIGMYVVAIFDGKARQIKSEGFVSSEKGIQKLHQAGITTLTIIPSRQRKPAGSNGFPSITITPPEKLKIKTKPSISLDDEMKTAHLLYKNAKSLQGKILDSIKIGQFTAMDDVKTTSDAMVDSIFRNQDALSCLSRLRDKGSYLMEHSLNVSILMAIFAKHLKIDKHIIKELTLGAFIHDIGKILIPNDILNKPSQLTNKEFNIVKSHVALGLKVLESAPSISHIAMSVLQQHHERLDGSGYPKQLASTEISKYGRMIAIIDSYDAMTAERVFRSGTFPINAFKSLLAESPEKYDQELVERFIQCLGVYPVGTLVKLSSGKLGMISKLNEYKPLHPYVKVFYNTRLNQAIPFEEINLSKAPANALNRDQIDCCIRSDDYNINLLGFFKSAFNN